MPKHALINHYVENLRRIATGSNDESVIFEQLGPLAKQLAADPAWIEDRFYEPVKETGFSAEESLYS
ncbi:hypothetical protein N9H39_01600 [Gammaproteobacteria bacterium]|nr:hypothetical protein [Gammaproteobacteria bacterium]